MLVDIGDRLLKVVFQYSDQLDTTCSIIDTDTQTLLGFSLAVCGRGDRFDKKIGRFLAFKRATQSPAISREERKRIWEVALAQMNLICKEHGRE